ncbi:Sigma-70, region 4 [Lentzea aerocolonigenes]|nr:Sigma-70, region 4 [Lentzea aerocolonigenes]
MTRRQLGFLDPTGKRGGADAYVRLLRAVLGTLSAREAGVITYRFGLLDGRPRTLDEIGRIYGIDRTRARFIESKVMSKLRHPSRSMVLRDFLDGEFVELPEPVRAELLGALNTEPGPLVHCDRHGWSESGPDVSRCVGCPCALAAQQYGRRRKYCSDACRQAAYRRRRSSEQGRAVGDGTEPA